MRLTAVVFALSMLLCAGAQAAPLEAYGQLPSLDEVTISPDGSRIAYLRELPDSRTIIAQDLATQQVLATVDVGGIKVRSVQWAGNDHLLLTTSSTDRMQIDNYVGDRREWFLVRSINLVTHQQRQLLEGVPKTLPVAAGNPFIRMINGKLRILLPAYYQVKTDPFVALFSFDLDGGDPNFMSGHSHHANDWAVDAAGNVVAESTFEEHTKHWGLNLNRGGVWSEVYSEQTAIETPDIDGFTADGSALVIDNVAEDSDANSGSDDDDLIYRPVALDTGKLGPQIDTGGHIGQSLLFDRYSSRVIGSEHLSSKREYKFLSPAVQAVWQRILGSLPNAEVRPVSWTPDWSKVVVEITGAQFGDIYVLVDVAGNKTIPIGPAYSGIAAADFAPVRSIEYKAADGLKISAYLTLPNGVDPKNLPLIVLPHGGPGARDLPGFDWWSQALASRGYAVLQPQFRGSTGYGASFYAAGFGQFGRKMQTDLSDGVRSLAAQGLVDPKRVCIVGASYGGYAALAGATLDPGVYRCAVAVSGVSDLQAFISWIQLRNYAKDDTSVRYWDRFVGVDKPNDPSLAAISPTKQAARVNIPVLLIHGKDDTVVPFSQSELMQDALSSAGKKVDFVVLQNEDHWLSRSATRLQMLTESVKFLEANNPPH